ncbi:MAG: hypothetical protein U0794_07325 [Isosphaeraceae bacterium]
MGTTAIRVAERLRAFVDNPITLLLRGLALFVIGMSEAWGSIQDDLMKGHLRVGHGLILIGLFNMLDALPHFLESLDAGILLLESRNESKPQDRPTNDERRPTPPA